MFSRPEKSQQVRRILRRRHSILGFFFALSRFRPVYLFEVMRHNDLAEALGIPKASVGIGYEYVHRGETPEGLNRGDLQETLSG